MKRTFRASIVLLMLIIATVTFVACGGSSPTGISINKSDMPQLTFVQGEELNLSGGKLTVEYGSKTIKIPFDSKGVVVSGYDKSKLGKQPLTVTYEGQTTTLTVNTVERLTVNLTNIYFEGEELNKEVEVLTYYKNDGKFNNISLSDQNITIGDYDFSAPGVKNVSIEYNDPESKKTYSGSFSVDVLQISEVTLGTLPKTDYSSHDKECDLNGFLTIKGVNGQTKNVKLSDAVVVKGFDFTQATRDNIYNPLVQEVELDYHGHSIKYNIRITYSAISVVLDAYNTIIDANIDWSNNGQNSEIPKEVGSEAMEAATLYMQIYSDSNNKLNKDLDIIPEDQRDLVLRVAIVNAYNDWLVDFMDSFDGVFALTTQGASFVLKDYESTHKAVEALKDKKRDYYTTYALLSSIVKDKQLSQIEIIDNVVVLDYLLGFAYGDYAGNVVFANDQIEYVRPVIELIVEIYDDMKDVNADNATSNGEIINAVCAKLSKTPYSGDEFRGFYESLADWNSDVFEAIYTFYASAGNENWTTLNFLANKVYIPYGLEDLYVYLVYAYDSLNLLQSFGSMQYAYQSDTASLIIYLKRAEEIANEIKSGMKKVLYDNLLINLFESMGGAAGIHFDVVLNTIKFPGNYGYYYYTSGYSGTERFDNLMNEYFDLYKELSSKDEGTFIASSEFDKAVTKLLNDFVAMSPAEQYGFISSLSSLYPVQDNYMENRYMMFDYSKYGISNTFIYFIVNFGNKVLKNDAQINAFNGLLIALEYYLDVNYTEAYSMDDFITAMDSYKANYRRLIGTNKSTYDNYMGTLHNKLDAIYNMYKNGTINDTEGMESESEALFKELNNALNDLSIVRSYLLGNRSNEYDIFCAVYEKAESIADKIRNGSDEKAKNLFYYGTNIQHEEESVSADYMLYSYRRLYTDILTSNAVNQNGKSVIPLEVLTPGIRDYLRFAADQYMALITSINSPGTQNAYFNKDEVVEIINAFLELTNEEKCLYSQISSMKQFNDVLRESFKEYIGSSYNSYESFITALFEMEEACINYLINPDGKIEDSGISNELNFTKAAQKAESEYKVLTEGNVDTTKLDEFFYPLYQFCLEENAKI